MNRIILCAALILVSLPGKTFAQNDNEPTWFKKTGRMSKTEKTFSNVNGPVRLRDYVYLRNNARMILELGSAGEFSKLKGLDSVLLQMREDIAFYKDSLENGSGNVRIDYVTHEDQEHREIRFEKHHPNGDMFVVRNGETAKLKIEEDTIRILMHVLGKEVPAKHKMAGKHMPDAIGPFRPQTTILVMFCLDNYTDIDKVIWDPEMLHHIIDTLAFVSTPKRKRPNSEDPYSTIVYRPFSTTQTADYPRYLKVKYVLDSEYTWRQRGGTLTINGSAGIGQVRNEIVPTAEIGIGIYGRWKAIPTKQSYLRLSATPYFFFDKDAQGRYIVNDNWFVNLAFGTESKDIDYSCGIGYLYAERGGYFQNTTMKAFLNIGLSKHIAIAPEYIFTNNFKQIFPGITLKVF